MGALINCVELKERAKNCAIMANLTAHPLSHASEGSRRGGQLSGEGGLSSKCLAPEFLAKLLVRCTRKFAHQLEGDRPDQGEEEPSSPSPQAKYGSITNGSRGADSTSLEIASKEQSMTPMTAQEAEGEDLMSHAEGADLVLGGHCALLLGLLIREQEGSRCEQRAEIWGAWMMSWSSCSARDIFWHVLVRSAIGTEARSLLQEVRDATLIENVLRADASPFCCDLL